MNQHISFVIPAYNCAETLEEAVESIYSGNFEQGDEIIIVNDASTDRTAEIIAGLVKKHPEIVALANEENRGCPASRNIGINAARNELIFNLDADNMLAAKSIRKLKAPLTTRGADIAAFGEIRYFLKNIRNISHRWIFNDGILTLSDLMAGTINPAASGNYLYTKKSWEKIGGYWEYGKGLNEAWGFSLKQIANGSKFIVVPDTYYFHRVGVESLTIRELRAVNAESLSDISRRFMQPFLKLIDTRDVQYIQRDRQWFERLNNRPIKVKGGTIGRNGEIIRRLNFAVVQARILRYFQKYLEKARRYSNFNQWKNLRKFKPANTEEKKHIEKLRDRFRSLTESADESALTAWTKNITALRADVLSKDPRLFINWPMIQYTMFHQARKEELDQLRRSKHWSVWREGLKESDIGDPPRYPGYPASSGNLIHHAYNLLQLVEAFPEVDLRKLSVTFEFGGGYGSFTRLLYQLEFKGLSIIQDFAEFSFLQEYFLSHLKIDLRIFHTPRPFNEKTVVLLSKKSDVEKQLSLTVKPDLFIATWSLSEISISARNDIEQIMTACKYVIIAYQDFFDNIDNKSYFRNLARKYSRYDWKQSAISHLPGNSYLIGRKNDNR
ncbi:glycosyltransferase family 2 protein [Patescibacteria group bacterium]|nr:glycosyltransferase family 2 protein [Patescibacteria group bacterium]